MACRILSLTSSAERTERSAESASLERPDLGVISPCHQQESLSHPHASWYDIPMLGLAYLLLIQSIYLYTFEVELIPILGGQALLARGYAHLMQTPSNANAFVTGNKTTAFPSILIVLPRRMIISHRTIPPMSRRGVAAFRRGLLFRFPQGCERVIVDA